MTEEETKAYRETFWKVARAYVELGKVVGLVKATEFLARFVAGYGMHPQRGGRPKKPTTPDPAEYSKLRREKKELATKDRAEQRRIQRRLAEPGKKAAIRDHILRERERLIDGLRRRGFTEDEIESALQIHPADRSAIDGCKAS